MIPFFLRILSFSIITLNVCLIFVNQFLNPDHFSDFSEELLMELPTGPIHSFYSYFFELIELPLMQGIYLSLLWILLIYLITVILFGLAKLTKVKVKFLKVTEGVVVSFSVIIFKGVIELLYFVINGQALNQMFFDITFALVLMVTFCFIIRSYVIGDKINIIIYNGLIIFGTVILSSFYVVLNFI